MEGFLLSILLTFSGLGIEGFLPLFLLTPSSLVLGCSKVIFSITFGESLFFAAVFLGDARFIFGGDFGFSFDLLLSFLFTSPSAILSFVGAFLDDASFFFDGDFAASNTSFSLSFDDAAFLSLTAVSLATLLPSSTVVFLANVVSATADDFFFGDAAVLADAIISTAADVFFFGDAVVLRAGIILSIIVNAPSFFFPLPLTAAAIAARSIFLDTSFSVDFATTPSLPLLLFAASYLILFFR
mmetsp:Transcript_21994/g.47805  ORF Transcript_21994/g.47805 Transcript_21994/m.47805 type:complete len:241 (+) Transcript_21994:1318-2040(+)